MDIQTNMLFNEPTFKKPSYEEWKQKVQAELKGKVEVEKLGFTDYDGLFIPAYADEHTSNFPWLQNLSQFAADTQRANWHYAELILVEKENEESFYNQQIKQAFQGGAEGLTIIISVANIQFTKLLNGVNMKEQPLHFILIEGLEGLVQNLAQFYPGLQALKGSLTWLGWFALPLNEALKQFLPILNQFPENSKFKVFGLTTLPLVNAGATASSELGSLLNLIAKIFELANDFNTALLKQLQTAMHIQFAAGTKYFVELAKPKSFQLLINSLFTANGLKQQLVPFQVISSSYYFSTKDVDTNILRNTTLALSAVASGAQSFTLLPHTNTDLPFAQRIARNISHLLREEGAMNVTLEIPAGSYYIEQFVDSLAKKAWEFFLLLTNTEKENDVLVILKIIEVEHAKRKAAFDSGEEIMIGDNKYPFENEQSNTLLFSFAWISEKANFPFRLLTKD